MEVQATSLEILLILVRISDSCWWLAVGPLGLGTTSDKLTPTLLHNLKDLPAVQAIYAGAGYSFALNGKNRKRE